MHTNFDKTLALVSDLLEDLKPSPESLLLHCYLADCTVQKYLCQTATGTVWTKQHDQPSNPIFWTTYQRYLQGQGARLISHPSFTSSNPELDETLSTAIRCSVAKHYHADQRQLLDLARETEPMQTASEGQVLDFMSIPESPVMQAWRLKQSAKLDN